MQTPCEKTPLLNFSEDSFSASNSTIDLEYQGYTCLEFIHDLKGNLTQDTNGQDYFWDIDNLMSGANVASGNYNYVYDAFRRRIQKVEPSGNSTTYIHNGWQVLSEYSNSANTYEPTQSYIYWNYIDHPLAMAKGSGNTMYYYHLNNQFSVYRITDKDKNVVETYRYEPHGTHEIDTGSGFTTSGNSIVGNPFMFTGRRFDAETKLHYFRNRMYDSYLGRFVGRDPAGYAEGYSLYAAYFAPGGVDPFGLDQYGLRWSPNPSGRQDPINRDIISAISMLRRFGVGGGMASRLGRGGLAGSALRMQNLMAMMMQRNNSSSGSSGGGSGSGDSGATTTGGPGGAGESTTGDECDCSTESSPSAGADQRRKCGVKNMYAKALPKQIRQFHVQMPFVVVTSLKDKGEYDPSCCKFVQYIRGEYQFRDKVIPYRLSGGKMLSMTEYREDKVVYNGSLLEATPINIGSTLYFRDAPGMKGEVKVGGKWGNYTIKEKDRFDMNLGFVGKILDICNMKNGEAPVVHSIKYGATIHKVFGIRGFYGTFNGKIIKNHE